MTGFADLPPARQEQIIRELMNDPMLRAANDFGQGAGFLGLDEQPESWDRMGEKNDLMSDLFRTTQTYLSDYVPDLYPEVEDPGQFTGYRSDVADLYRNNPAYQQLDKYLAEGASFDEAVQLVAGDEQYAKDLPSANGIPDSGGFRSSAEKYVSERAREGREFDQFDAEQQAYDDYVRSRTGWDINPGVEDISGSMRRTDPVQLARQFAPRRDLTDVIADRRMVEATPKNASVVPPAIRKSQREVQNPNAQRAAAGNRKFNADMQAAYDVARQKKEAVQAPSKKQENNARLVRAYNLLMYGE